MVLLCLSTAFAESPVTLESAELYLALPWKEASPTVESRYTAAQLQLISEFRDSRVAADVLALIRDDCAEPTTNYHEITSDLSLVLSRVTSWSWTPLEERELSLSGLEAVLRYLDSFPQEAAPASVWMDRQAILTGAELALLRAREAMCEEQFVQARRRILVARLELADAIHASLAECHEDMERIRSGELRMPAVRRDFTWQGERYTLDALAQAEGSEAAAAYEAAMRDDLEYQLRTSRIFEVENLWEGYDQRELRNALVSYRYAPDERSELPTLLNASALPAEMINRELDWLDTTWGHFLQGSPRYQRFVAPLPQCPDP